MSKYWWLFSITVLVGFVQCHGKLSLSSTQGNVTSSSIGADNAPSVSRQHSKCRVALADRDFHSYIDKVEYNMRVMLFEIHLRTVNTSIENDSLHTAISTNYKPFLWYKTRTRHGRTLLMLSFHYDILSMTILTIGVQRIEVNITESPRGCMGRMLVEDRMTRIRSLLLGKSKSAGEDKYSTSSRDYVCNQKIIPEDGYADFKYKCCYRGAQSKVICSSQDDDPWISILYISVTVVKVLVFCFCPMFLPNSMYSAVYVAAEYVLKLKKPIKKTIYIAEDTDYKIRYKERLTIEQISDWWRLRAMLDTLPQNEVIPIKMSDVRMTVKGKRILPENDPPTGLMKTFYDNMCRCKIKGIDPFTDCCDLSIWACMEPRCSRRCTWHKFVQTVVKVMMLLLMPFPYYIRLLIYYKFEKDEMDQRRGALSDLGLSLKYNFYRTNIIQHYSPIHGVFIACYIFYFLSGIVIGFSEPVVRDRLKAIARKALQDMNAISQTGVLQVLVRIGLWPFKKCGLVAILIAPLYMCITMPFCLIIFTLYCVPTVYLSFRIIYQTKKQIGEYDYLDEDEVKKRRKFRKIHNLGKKLSRMDKVVHKATADEEDSCCPSSWGFNGLTTIKSWLLQIVCGGFCLCVLYAIALIFAESFGLIVEVLACTMMGIIVNASSTLKYVSMVLLVFVYMHDCYNNVYMNYLEFNKTIIAEMIDRAEDLKKIASLPSSIQENAAFQLKCSDEVPEIKTDLNFKKKEVRWRIGQLLLFLDSFDTPRIPLRLFQRLCDVQIHGAPGPVYLNLLAATGKFLVIVVFLLFVMIVVMAFGNVTRMSSTNQTLATLAGGFVPMLLKNVLSSKSIKLNLKTISFKGQIDEIIGEYKQFWPVKDLVIERDYPDEEDEDGEKDGGKDGGDNNGKKEDGKDKSGKGSDCNGNKEADKKSPLMENEKKKIEEDLKESAKENIKRKGSNAGVLINRDDGMINTDHKSEEQEVDLFIDLSSADGPCRWSYRGSTESLPGDTMLPYNFPKNTPYGFPEPGPINPV